MSPNKPCAAMGGFKTLFQASVSRESGKVRKNTKELINKIIRK